jgi:hypothetical protein
MATPTTGAARTTATATSSARLAVALGAVAALIACGGGGGVPAAGPRPAAPGPPSAEALAAVQGAAAGALSRTATISMTLSGGALFGVSASRVDGAGTYDFSALRGALSFTPAGSRTSEPVIFTPTAVYVRPPAGAGSLLPAGKSWTVADFTDPEALTSNFPKLIPQAESVNPALTVGQLLWGGTAAAPAGHEAVDGQDAARYAVTVDLNRAADAVSGPARIPFARALATEVVALGGPDKPATLTVSVWVSAAGRLARVMAAPPGTGVGTVTTSLRGVGVSVHADPPPAAQVVDVLQLGPTGERENKNGGDSDGG